MYGKDGDCFNLWSAANDIFIYLFVYFRENEAW